MASLNLIAQAYIDSVDSPFDHGLKERIKFTIKYWRIFLLRQEFERRGADRSILQGYVEELVDVDAFDTCVVTSGCVVKRTKNKVPRTLSIKGGSNFSYVGVPKYWCKDMPLSFTESSPNDLATACYATYAPNVDRFRYINDYIYIYDKPLMKYLYIEGYPEDPTEFHANCITAANCVSDDDEFPIGMHMLKTIIDGIRNNELSIKTDDQEVSNLP